ncbi:MAG: hypothetical protein K2K55_08105, partial [Duncaniella sp.]|nr:hypothetical protein [Duncaniella sp.]
MVLPKSLQKIRAEISGDRVYLFLNPAAEIKDIKPLPDTIGREHDFVYSDYLKGDETVCLIDWQEGSIRDDFDFGPFIIVRKTLFDEILDGGLPDYEYAGWYDLWLRLSEKSAPFHYDKPLYRVVDKEEISEGEEKHFAYVNPRNREVQIEMEKAATAHLKRINALIGEGKPYIEEDTAKYPVVASVVIPVLNRKRTIADAVRSALSQKAD